MVSFPINKLAASSQVAEDVSDLPIWGPFTGRTKERGFWLDLWVLAKPFPVLCDLHKARTEDPKPDRLCECQLKCLTQQQRESSVQENGNFCLIPTMDDRLQKPMGVLAEMVKLIALIKRT